MTAGTCTHPVRLHGRIDAIDRATGELRSVYDTTTDEPGGELLVACGNRRESVCPHCSAVYKRDACQLVRAGLTGGKGLPGTISVHPCVFATFTAPSFGPVHARRMRGQTVLPFPIDPADHPGCPALRLRFGTQVDVKPIRPSEDLPATGRELSVQAVGNYIAKYATKSLEAPGLPARPIASRLDIDGLRCPAHYRRMVIAAWELGGGRLTAGLRPTRLCRWAHQLGHGGHFLTKSCRYSVTFGQLRRARTEHRRAQRHPDGAHDPWGRPLDDRVVLIVSTWAYAGTRNIPTPEAELALASADHARQLGPAAV